MDEILAQQELQEAVLALASRLSSGHDGTMDSRLLYSFMFRLPTACGEFSKKWCDRTDEDPPPVSRNTQS